jgi:hypothetical protein
MDGTWVGGSAMMKGRSRVGRSRKISERER